MFAHSYYFHESDHRYAPGLAHVNIYELKYEAKTTDINIYFNISLTKPFFRSSYLIPVDSSSWHIKRNAKF